MLRWPLITFLLITLAAIAFAFLPFSWEGWERAPCWPDRCFCEAGRAGPVAEPSDTYSNLSYVLVGLLVLGASLPLSRRKRGGVRTNSANLLDQPAYPLVYGVSVVAIGLGSLFYHASLTLAGRWFDLMGMYLFAAFLVLYNLARLRRVPGWAFALGYVAINAFLGWLLVVVPEIRRQVFGWLIALALGLEVVVLLRRRPRIQIRYFYGALASFAIAYLVWNLEDYGIWCDPHSWLQGHVVWHLLTALAAGLLFVYYRSETAGAN